MKLKEWLEQNQDKEIVFEDGKLIITEPEPNSRWKPEQGDLFFYIIAGGEVYKGRWTRDLNDEMIYAMGNVFKTAKEAEDAAECLKIRAELLDCGGHGFVKGEDNVTISYDPGWDCLIETTCKLARPIAFAIYFDNDQAARDAIETVGEDRIKKYLFGIEG